MKNIPSLYQQHRCRTGVHTIRLQKKQPSQTLQQKHCQTMASRPGWHSKNIHRQNISYAMLQIFSVLSLIQSDSAALVRQTKNTESWPIDKYNYTINTLYPQILSNFSVSSQKETTRALYIHCPDQWITETNNAMAIINRFLSHFMSETGNVFVCHDRQREPVATALAMTEKKQRSLKRQIRYIPAPTKKNIPPAAIDDVKMVKLYDFSCMNEGEGHSFAEILKHISESLKLPVMMFAKEVQNIISWSEGLGCPEANDIQEVARVTQYIDSIVSQIIGLLPYARPLSIAQSIVSPLLSLLADDLMDKPVSADQEFDLIREITQQSRVSIQTINNMGRMSMSLQSANAGKKTPLALPRFYIKNGVNHIHLERQGHIYSAAISDKNNKVFATLPKDIFGREKRYQVYYNHLAHKWKVTGNGRFNRFSQKEKKRVNRLSIGTHFIYQHQGDNLPAIYTALNPFSVIPEKISAVEMFGQLVPFRYQSGTHQPVIYHAAQKKGQNYEIVLARNEWHLKLPAEKKVKFFKMYSPEYSRTLKVDMIRENHGLKIYAQINTDTGFLWGEKFVGNQHGHLELLSPQGKLDKFYKNSIDGPLLSGKKKTAIKNSKNKESSQDILSYERRSGCFRMKRGAVIGHMCAEDDNGNAYRQTQDIDLSQYPVIAEGSIGAVYDYQPDRVIKKYKGKIDERHKSRLQAAKNNAKGFNRFYGNSSATIEITSNNDGTASVLVKMKKVTGTPLSRVDTITDKSGLNTLLDIIQNDNPAEQLANKLQQLGIIHNDINKGNVIYDGEHGFHIIDFDSAHYLPDGESVNSEITDTMKKKFTYVFNDVRRDILSQLSRLN